MSLPVVALLTNSLSGGGAERAATTLANLLADTGVVRPVLVPARSGDADLVTSRAEVVTLDKRPGSGIAGLTGALPAARTALRALRPAVVHAHCELPELMAVLLTPRGSRLCVTEHARTPWSEHPTLGRAVRRGLALRSATWAVPQADLPVWSLDAVAPAHVPNPLIDVTARWSGSVRADRPLHVVAVGRMVALKRFDWLVRAVAERPDELSLTLVGDGEERAALERLAVELSAPVTFAGYQADPWPVALECDVYVTPSSTEADPMSLAEALLHEMPVLASDIASHRGQGLDPAQLFAGPTELAAALDAVLSSGLDQLRNLRAAEALRTQRSGSAVAAAQLRAYGLG